MPDEGAEEKVCPFQSKGADIAYCYDDCMLYCIGEHECSFKLIAMELIKINERA